jgi:dipeptide/tripeptide permease
MLIVLGNFRFMLFLLIFSGYWVVYWQVFIGMPLFIRGYVSAHGNVDLWIAADAATVIFFQILVSFLTRKIPAVPAITLGIVITSLSWIILAVHPVSPGGAAAVSAIFQLFGKSVVVDPAAPMVVLALVVVALGEMTQSPRYYEYVSRLAPPGQEGMFMGYAFLPIAIGYFISGVLAGTLVHYFGEVVHQPGRMWWVISGIGFATALLMWLYNAVVTPKREVTCQA